MPPGRRSPCFVSVRLLVACSCLAGLGRRLDYWAFTPQPAYPDFLSPHRTSAIEHSARFALLKAAAQPSKHHHYTKHSVYDPSLLLTGEPASRSRSRAPLVMQEDGEASPRLHGGKTFSSCLYRHLSRVCWCS